MNVSELHESILKNSQLTFARSGGKGGQNVNKVNTKVHLVLPFASVGGITDEERAWLRQRLSSIMNSDGCLYVDVDDERTQELNRRIALSRMESRIVNALRIPKKRKKTKPTQANPLAVEKEPREDTDVKRRIASLLFLLYVL